jgi:nitrogen fixation NifU-like protein
MPSSNNELETRKIIMEHYSNPTHKGFTKNENKDVIEIKKNSESCNDNVNIQFIINKDKIESLRFEGHGCVISMATANALSQSLENKTTKETIDVLENYHLMLKNKEYNINILKSLEIFKNISKQKNRIKCATLLSEPLLEYLKKEGK